MKEGRGGMDRGWEGDVEGTRRGRRSYKCPF